MTDNWIHFHRPDIRDEDIAEVVACLKSGWLTTGARAAALEERFAAYQGTRHAVALNSCTAALHLALQLLDLSPGDEVITTPLTFVATANAIVHAGGRPRFVDIDPETLNIDVGAVEAAIGPRTRALLPVHFAGAPCDLDRLRGLADTHGCFLLQDAAHAVETRWRGRPVAAYGDAAAYSFYATKNMTTAEGGMLTLDDDQQAGMVRCLRLHGLSRDAWKRYASGGRASYTAVAHGFKANLSDLQAALGLRQFDRIDEMWARRKKLVARYNEMLGELLPELRQVVVAGDDAIHRHAYHLFVVLLPVEELEGGRQSVIDELTRRGIGVGIHFQALHELPLFERYLTGTPRQIAPSASWVGERCLSLPLYPTLSESEQERIVTTFTDVIRSLQT